MKIEINTDIIFIKYEYIIIMHIYYYLLSDLLLTIILFHIYYLKLF